MPVGMPGSQNHSPMAQPRPSIGRTPTPEIDGFGLGISPNPPNHQIASPILGKERGSDEEEDLVSFTPEPEPKKIKSEPETPNTEHHAQSGVGGESPLAIKSE
jgi:hypothetical protein